MPPAEPLSENTVLTIKAGAMIALITGVFYAGAQFQSMKIEMKTLQEVSRERWTFEMEKDAWNHMSRHNPEINIPDVYRIRDANRQ
jgi:hypothetical protein